MNPSGIQISIISSAEQLQQAQRLVQDLANNAIEPNIFYEPWMLLPAWKNLNSQSEVQLILVCFDGGQAIGLFPLETKTKLRWIPVRHHALWKHIHCFLCTPLLRIGNERAALTEFIKWYKSWKSRGLFIAMREVSHQSPFTAALNSLHLKTIETAKHDRALLGSGIPSATYLEQAISAKKRKEFRRQHNRLSEQGELRTVIMSGTDSVDEWTAQFLALEKKGWKGQVGSALAEHDSQSKFFAEIVQNAFSAGRLIMLKLLLNGEPIAMKCSFRANQGSFAFKIAYDEAFARFSPGVLLELENIRYVLDHTELKWMDSCADPNHPMINHLWRERKIISSFLIGTGSPMSVVFGYMLLWLSKFRPRRVSFKS